MNTERNRTSATIPAAIMTSIISAGIFLVISQPTHIVPAFAQEETAGAETAASSKLIGAGMAFGLAALGAGIGLGFVGCVALAG